MRFTFESDAAKEARLAVWRKWFAWHPVWIGDTLAWLECVERCETWHAMGGWIVDYRFIKEQP